MLNAPVLGHLDFNSPSASRSKIVTFWRYHKIKTDSLQSDLANCLLDALEILLVPSTSIQNYLLYKHAPKVSHTFHTRRQFEHKDKSLHNGARLRKHIDHCTSLFNRDKSNYYWNFVSDPNKLWQVLRS